MVSDPHVAVVANKTLIRRWLAFGEAGFNGDFDPFIARDYVGYLSGKREMDFDQLVEAERRFASAFSDVRYGVDDLVAEGDKVVLRVTTTATHTAAFLGMAATHRRVTFSGIVIYRIQDGRIAESWGEVDFRELWRQLNET